MKFNKFTAAAGCAVLIGSLVLSACGGSKKEETTAAATTAVTVPATTVPETTKAAVTAKLNFDYANLMSDDYDSAVKFFGKPDSEKEQDISKILKWNSKNVTAVLYSDDETANNGRQGAVWLIEASAGDLFTMSGDASTSDEFFAALKEDIQPKKTPGNNIEGYEFGKSTSDLYSFEMDGYQFEIIPESDGSIKKDSRAVIICTQEVEPLESETDGE